jgi:hypothetical protein
MTAPFNLKDILLFSVMLTFTFWSIVLGMDLENLADHLNIVATSFLRGYVAPLLGAGVNLSSRPRDYKWSVPGDGQAGYLPNGAELAGYIAHEFRYDSPAINIHVPPPNAASSQLTHAEATGATADSDTQPSFVPSGPAGPDTSLPLRATDFDLMQISQSAEIDHGPIPLIQSLSSLFARPYPVSPAHRFFARVPRILADEPPFVRYQLIMTTNYDNLMEIAFQDAGQEYDLIWYEAEGNRRGRFMHKPPRQPATLMPQDYGYAFFECRPVILKLHGTVVDRTNGSYVITQDHYIHYTARIDDRALPKTLTARWVNFLYLGYALRDFNLRVIVRRLQEADGLSRVSWAVLRNPPAGEVRYWQRNNVELISINLDEYLDQLESRIRALTQGAR